MNIQDTLLVRIAQRIRETDDIITLELRHPNGAALPKFEAGAHIDVHVAPGVVRQYSLCNPPSERDRYVIGVLRDPASRGGSIAIHERMEAGTTVQISVPRNHFPLQADKPAMLIAGGIGITPMLCMAEALHASGADFALHYCARCEDKAAFLGCIAQSPYRQQVAFHYDDQDAGQKLDPASLFADVGSEHEIYVCGPAGFIEWICREAEAAGIPKQRVRYEYFSAKPVDTSYDGTFDVKIASTGQVLHIPADRSITSVLLDAGIDIYTSCGEGTCGTCVTRVLEGEPDHRDVFLTDDEHACGDQFTPCCSRAKSSMLVLDL